jgi:ribosomal protein S18 acetylase RimI-like enzyme
MMRLTRLNPGQQSLHTVAQFIALLNDREEHHIGYVGTTPAEVVGELQALDALHETWVAAWVQGQMVGVMGVDSDPETGLSWLYGPFVSEGDWPTTADALWAATRQLAPATVLQYQIFVNAKNHACLAFAERHGFILHSQEAILRLERSAVVSSLTDAVREATDAEHLAFGALHDRLFPKQWYSSTRILADLDDQHKLFIIGTAEHIDGYAYVRVHPAINEGWVEFLGVAEHTRGQGHGRQLLGASLQWMFTFALVQQVFLTCRADNAPALHLYQRMGFQRLRTMQSLTKAA